MCLPKFDKNCNSVTNSFPQKIGLETCRTGNRMQNRIAVQFACKSDSRIGCGIVRVNGPLYIYEGTSSNSTWRTPSGYPSKYYPGPTLLDFGDQMGTEHNMSKSKKNITMVLLIALWKLHFFSNCRSTLLGGFYIKILKKKKQLFFVPNRFITAILV
jgi:hypothetical protein